MWESIWNLLNSPAVITAIAGVVLWLLNRLYAKKPLWAQFEGTLIEAVRFAEKAVPDDAESKAVRRLDAALKYVLKIYEGMKSRPATPNEIDEIKDGIRIVHNELDTNGVL
jgi:hypothetical protein